ncbi:hypothetical protein CSKR_113272 [Clonorchis sinensis]|uniref:Uncharacterized protein n=1 Tax=Clonorchis sinensis TaxID=79923 RepID=A0A3R7F3N1_CLOSI|nr:hypothetical protein CSKR_113272 [Clonorchis sinensis]
MRLPGAAHSVVWKHHKREIQLGFRAPTLRQEDDYGPQPKPSAQKPDRKAEAFGWKCKHITVFKEQAATHVPTPNLKDQKNAFVRPLTIDQPGMRDCECRADILQYGSKGRREMQLPKRIREIHSFANQFGFCERLTWNPAESPVFDISRQLNVLHQAASSSSCYDIRDIVIHNIRLTETRGLRLLDEPQEGQNPSWTVEEFSATL